MFWDIIAIDFDTAKKEFAQNCYNDLNNGVHGDDYISEDSYSINELKKDGVDTDFFSVDGIYLNGQLIMPYSDVIDGIEYFSEDVYTWRLLENGIKL